MPIRPAYFDTSVLLKRYFHERGSSTAQSLLGRHRLVSSAIAPIEAMSAICRRRNANEIAGRAFLRVTRQFQKDRAKWELIELTPQILDMAEQLVQQQSVRSLDAIHLASALILQAASGFRFPFITSDARQREAAAALMLDVVWVD